MLIYLKEIIYVMHLNGDADFYYWNFAADLLILDLTYFLGEPIQRIALRLSNPI